MPSLNKCVLIGRLTRDPELRHTAAGVAVASFSIAVDRRFKDAGGEKKTDFFRCTAWRQTAEFVSNHIQKGRLVAVSGAVEINEYTDRDGAKRQSVDVQCDMVEALEWPKDGEQGEAAPPEPPKAAPAAARPAAPARPAPRPAAQPVADVMLDGDKFDPFEDE